MIIGQEAAARLQEIANASTTADGVTRLPWTAEHRLALEHIGGWMRDAGLSVTLDPAGTLVGSSPNPAGKPVLLIGSHQDSVPSGGRYDGIMGVALGCLVARNLQGGLAGLPFALEVMAFADEEGVRFPTALIGPRALAGTLDPAALDLRDRDGVTMRDAMDRFGVDTSGTCDMARAPGRIFGYLEVHIEQGPVLEAQDRPVAAVTAICGIARFEVVIEGATGHAGTVPMKGRQDALVAAARIITLVNERATAATGIRATVGHLSVLPGAVNAIPARATFPIEIRAEDDTLREGFEALVTDAARDICRDSDCRLSMRRTYDQPATTCDATLRAALESAIADSGFDPSSIPSGATHDASAMADLCPVAMLFVRCRGGISHRSDEHAEAGDMEIAVQVLTRAIERMAQDAAGVYDSGPPSE